MSFGNLISCTSIWRCDRIQIYFVRCFDGVRLNKGGHTVFGFTKKEKLTKLIIESSKSNIEQYKSDARDWMERGRRDLLDEKDREKIYMEIRRNYCDAVEEDVVAAISEEDPSMTEKIEKIIMNPSLCGYKMDLTSGILMAGRVFAICYYAIRGVKADPDDCVSLNNMQNDLMNRAMGEITEEYLKMINGEYVAYNHLDEIVEKQGGASAGFVKMIDDMKKNVADFRAKAEEGDVLAQCDLALCYYYGFGVPKDARAAYSWFELSAKQGNEVSATFMKYIEDEREIANLQDADVQFDLGWAFYTGEGQKKDYLQAAECFRRAARRGHVSAQYNLAVMYLSGEGMNKNTERAIYWYEKAADKGNIIAAYNLGTIYLLGKGIDKDYKRARYWLRFAAEHGNSDAQYNLGLMYDRGDGMEQDYEEAAMWYEKASAQGDPKAQYNLALMFDEGRGVISDAESALRLYRLAADNGYKRAWLAIGMAFDEGRLVERDPAEAANWYAKAAEAQDPKAQYNLGLMYDRGEGVDVDHSKAKELYEASAKLGYLKAVDILRKMNGSYMSAEAIKESGENAEDPDEFEESAAAAGTESVDENHNDIDMTNEENDNGNSK